MTTTISKHLRKKDAQKRANELNTMHRGLSSGWSHFDYTVRRSTSLFRKWRVVSRHVR